MAARREQAGKTKKGKGTGRGKLKAPPISAAAKPRARRGKGQRPRPTAGEGAEDEDANDFFDEAARELFSALNVDPGGALRSRRSWQSNVVFRHPTSGAVLEMGTAAFASSKAQLSERNITCIVNCQSKSTRNFHEADPAYEYFRFPIAFWQRHARDGAGAARYLAPVFEWIDVRLAGGKNVLVHCLAGAHRAGTTGTCYVMHATGLNAADALAAVQACRPIVQPIGSFSTLVALYDSWLEGQRAAKEQQAAAGGGGEDDHQVQPAAPAAPRTSDL